MRYPSAFSISGVSPASGAISVPRDTGIIVSGVATPAIPGERLGAEVELIDVESGLAVALREVSWYSRHGTDNVLALHPVEPLAALHDFRVEARPLDEEKGELGPAFVSSFSTSEASLEPLVLSGELVLSLRGGEVDRVEYGPCGGTNAVGKRRALLADVQLPTPSGGQGAYRSNLYFTPDTPVRVGARDVAWPFGGVSGFNQTQSVDIESGTSLVSQEVIQLDEEYAGCFTFVVWDPAGNFAQASACLPSLTSEEIGALAQADEPVELAASDDAAEEQVDAAITAARRPDRAPVWSCAVGAIAPGSPPAWLALLLGSAVLARARRWRVENRPRQPQLPDGERSLGPRVLASTHAHRRSPSDVLALSARSVAARGARARL